MKRKINQIKVVGFLTFALVCFNFNFGISTAAQETNRQRTVEKPTLTLIPTPKPTATPKQTPLPTVSPTPFSTPTATPTPVQIQTIPDLQSRINSILARPELRRGQIGVKIVSLDTNRSVFEMNAEKYFMPASNMKSYTVAAALEKLSPDFRFVTSVFAPGLPDASGTIRGDLTVFGRGDISLSGSFNDSDFYKGLDALASKIAQAGVKRIEGNLVGDESYFSGNPIPYTWEWDDLQWNSGAEISALSINNNTVKLSVKPGAINMPCVVQIQPPNAIYRTLNQCSTSNASKKSDIKITKKLDLNVLEVSGTMPPGDKGFDGTITVSHPADLFVEMLRGLLVQKGVVITGQNRVIGTKDKVISTVASIVPAVEITKLESPPFSVIAAKTMKPSQNLYTETILWTLGEQGRTIPGVASSLAGPNPFTNPKSTSAERGVFVVQNFLKEIGIAPDSVIQWDGSGLSRHNLVTPASAVQLYIYMARSRYAQVWRESLTIGGVDGTLQNRFKGTAAAANVRGKTGTIDQVSALSGYVTTASGERIVFSIIINGVNDVRLRQAVIDEIVVALANFNGKTN
ncbi:MAG: D-alanyl-D-alanine carboxypeptidase/D-alanyl-D-alanine-endopeptidase [Acidobacteria bacterium]|nr:D-alanyl-D-alanine carboxypeptidase/D-alanyl-D-alanine-endopeptidase [Acidobacteriota bacterium]MCA1639082.1 D-alanyl-D-alanine carboxypeptidase/D-alanyl-D-alanine-endopeptidase [Acidobacteriota bacterium]